MIPTCPQPLIMEDASNQSEASMVGSRVLDSQNLEIVCEQFGEWADQGNCRSVLLNFAHLKFLSSVGLCQLLTLRKKLSAHGGQLFLCNLNPNIREVFEATKLDVVFN